MIEIPENSRVIVYVDPPNRPAGWWIGRTTGAPQKYGSMFRCPVILSEPAEVTETSNTTDYKGMSPTPTCWVYSDTREVRQLMHWSILARIKNNNRMRELESRTRTLMDLQAQLLPMVNKLLRMLGRSSTSK